MYECAMRRKIGFPVHFAARGKRDFAVKKCPAPTMGLCRRWGFAGRSHFGGSNSYASCSMIMDGLLKAYRRLAWSYPVEAWRAMVNNSWPRRRAEQFGFSSATAMPLKFSPKTAFFAYSLKEEPSMEPT